MSGIFEPKSVPQKTQDELNARTGPKGIEWNAKKFPWVHLMSMASSDSPYKILTSITSGPVIGTLYEQGSNRPKPIITGVKVKKQGEFGTTRRATVSITAFTDEQLSQLQLAFFIPGMTVRVQFGWSISATGDLAPAPYEAIANDPKAVCEMNSKAAGSAVYEGLQGIVSNFSYSLNSENCWECSLEIISASEPFMSTTMGNSCCPCPRLVNDENGKKIVKQTRQLKAFFTDIAHKYENFYGYYDTIKKAGDKEVPVIAGLYSYEGEERNDDGSSPSIGALFSQVSTGESGQGFVQRAGAFVRSVGTSIANNAGEAFNAVQNVFSEGTEETFISFGTLEKAIAAFEFPATEDNKSPFGILSSRNMKIRTHKDLESADPRVCFIGGTKRANKIVEHEKGLNALEKFKANAADGVLLQNIMINTVFLAIAYSATIEQSPETATIDSFLKYVLDGINKACGNLWELEVVSTTEKCPSEHEVPSVTVVDSLIIPDQPPPAPYQIPSSPNNSVVRDLKMELKMTDAMKSQALYSNKLDTAKTCTSEDSCKGVGLLPLTAPKETRIEDGSKPPATKSEVDCSCQKVEDPERVPEDKEPSFDELFDDLVENVKDSTVSSVTAQLNKLYNNPGNGQKKDIKKDCPYVNFPFSLVFTVDGVGGFKFGQRVSSTRLPSNVRDKYLHQITVVEHDVSAQDWTTTVETVARWIPQ